MSYLCQIGTYSPKTDAFTLLFDCNDGQNLEMDAPSGLDLPPPPLDVYASANPRLPGARVTSTQYGPRVVTLDLVAGPAANYAALAAVVTELAQLPGKVRAQRLMAQAGLGAANRICLKLQPPLAPSPLYADVLAASFDVPDAGDTASWVRLIQEGMTLELVCAPFLRGPRVTLENGIFNPGFQAGGSFVAFADAFATQNAYTTTGGSLGNDKSYYGDTLQADGPLRWFRLDETSGTTCTDAMGSGSNGTTHGSPTLGVAGLLTGDSDKAMTFAAASSQYVSAPYTGLPTGNNPWTLEAWVKTPASFSAQMEVMTFGQVAAHEEAQLYIDATGHAIAGTNSGDTAGFALAAATVYHLVATWDGTTLTLYVNGVSKATATPAAMTIPGSGNFATISGSPAASPGAFYNGTLDECAFYTVALSSTRVAAHYTAGTTTPATNAASLSVPVGATTLFGNSSWGAIQKWLVGFRYFSGADSRFFLHYTDANNHLFAQLSGGNLVLYQRVAGTLHQVATVACVLPNEALYWIQLTAFPQFGLGVTGQAILVQAVVSANSNGAPGNVFATCGPAATFDAATAMSGQMGFYASSGGSIGVDISSTVTLFGPGSWSFVNAGTGLASAAWAASNYTGGPIASQACVQVQAAPAGTLDAYLSTVSPASSAAVQANGYPIASGVVLGAACVVKSSGLGASCAQALKGYEYDASGNFLRSTTIASVTGNQAGWTALSGTWTTGASCAYTAVELRATDAGTGSVSGLVWWDNAQLWNVTLNGSTMPYCELNCNGPAQLLVSGLLGDVPAPADVTIGTNASIAAGASLSCYLGRRAVAGWNTILEASAVALSADGVHQTYALDANAVNGAHASWLTGSSNWTAFMATFPAGDGAGAYHLLARARVTDTPASAQYVQTLVYASQVPWLQSGSAGVTLGGVNGMTINPFTGNTWQAIDAGLVQSPAGPGAASSDGTQLWSTIAFLNQVSTTEMDVDWLLLLPVDGELLALDLANPAGLPTIAGWIWLYADGLGEAQGITALAWSLETARVPNAGHAAGAGGVSNFAPYLNGVGDRVLRVDPGGSTINPLGVVTQGVNQLAGVLLDGNADVLPLVCTIAYSPLYLAVR